MHSAKFTLKFQSLSDFARTVIVACGEFMPYVVRMSVLKVVGEASLSVMRDRIETALRDAGVSGDKTRLSMLRLIKSAIADKDSLARSSGNQDEVSDETIISVLNGMIERRKQTVVTYEEQGQFELADTERTEIQVLRELLPRQLDDQEIVEAIGKAVRATKAKGVRDKGRVMLHLKSNYAGRMDFRTVGRRVVDRLSVEPGRSGGERRKQS